MRAGAGPAVHEDRPVQGAHELDVVDAHVAGQRILLLEDPGAAQAAPLVRRGVRAALIFGCAQIDSADVSARSGRRR